MIAYFICDTLSSANPVIIGTRSLEAKKKEVMLLFTKITKEDVSLNNYITRGKNLVMFGNL